MVVTSQRVPDLTLLSGNANFCGFVFIADFALCRVVEKKNFWILLKEVFECIIVKTFFPGHLVVLARELC